MSAEKFLSAGVVPANPLVPDADPNVTPPAASRLFEIGDRNEQGRVSTGVEIYAEFDTPSIGGLTYTATVWIKDEANNNFIKTITFTAGDFEGVKVSDIAPAVMFIQVTAISAGTINNINLFGTPL